MNIKKIPNQIPVVGDLSFRGDCPSEAAETVLFFQLLRSRFPELAAVATHIRNEGKKSYQQAAKQRSEGLNKGAPDIAIMTSPPILIELKRKNHTKSTISPEQIGFLVSACELGCHCAIALGASAGMEFISKKLNK